MSDNLSNIKQILAKNSYEVVVELSSSLPREIRFLIPARRILPGYDSFIVCYTTSIEEGKVGLSYKVADSDKVEFIDCPEYSFRTLISVDIKKVCQQIEYDFSLVSFLVDGEPKSEEEFFNTAINLELDELEKEKEECLKYILMSFELEDKSPDISKYASEDYLEEVYDVVRSFYGIAK